MINDSPAIRNAYLEHGYYHARAVFSPAEVAELTAEYDRIVAQLLTSGDDLNARWGNDEAMARMGASDSVVLHTNNVQQYSARWMRALYQERFLSTARALLGEDVVLHHTKLFQKPPAVGAPFPMHQDWTYFPTAHDTMLAGIVHLSDATDEMGCLRVYPGSHRAGRLPDSNGQTESPSLAAYPIEDATPVEAVAGDVVFFNYLTLHGSLPNRSAHTRKTVLVQLYAGTDLPDPDVDHPDEKLVLSGWNHHAARRNTAA